MMDDNDVRKLVKYWCETAEHDYETMEGLLGIKRYADCLFYAHITLEKILKALAVKQTEKDARYTHNLLILAEDAELELSEKEEELLAEVNRFNVKARYPDEKLRFYKMCTKAYTENYLKEIKKIYRMLCLKLKQEN